MTQTPTLTPEDWADAQALIRLALAEDIGSGDLTSASVIPADLHFRGVMAARHPMVVCGLPLAAAVFAAVVPDAVFTPKINDGATITTGTVLAEIQGPARGLLTAERVALNLLQLLSGIATLTHEYAVTLAGTACTLLDTRKTIPGLRRLSKYATRCGGAQNHRMGLYDAILIKDNHLAVCGGVVAAVAAAKATGTMVEVECDTLSQVEDAVTAGADIILLDNMAPDVLRQAVALVKGRCKTEASGGVSLDTLAAIGTTGVDFVSVGRITQSAPAVDIGLDWA